MVLPHDAIRQDVVETRKPSPEAKQMGLLNRRLSQTVWILKNIYQVSSLGEGIML